MVDDDDNQEANEDGVEASPSRQEARPIRTKTERKGLYMDEFSDDDDF